MDKNFSIQPREPLLEKQYPRPLGNDKMSLGLINLYFYENPISVLLHQHYRSNIFLFSVVKGGCDNGWSEDQFKRDCQPVSSKNG